MFKDLLRSCLRAGDLRRIDGQGLALLLQRNGKLLCRLLDFFIADPRRPFAADAEDRVLDYDRDHGQRHHRTGERLNKMRQTLEVILEYVLAQAQQHREAYDIYHSVVNILRHHDLDAAGNHEGGGKHQHRADHGVRQD